MSKVRDYDNSVPLDLERRQFMVPVIERLVAMRRGELCLWPFEYEQLRIEFAQAISKLRFRGVGFHFTAYGAEV